METRGALLTVVAPLVVLKLWATALLLAYAPTREAVAVVVATHWAWVVVGALLLAAPTIAWSRLVRMRARREQLRRSEWMLEPERGSRPRGDTSALPLTQWPLWETASRSDRDS